MSHLPLDLPPVTAGFAAITRAARDAGHRAAEAAAAALAATLGHPVSLSATPRPCAPEPLAGAARLSISLGALPGSAVLEVDARLAARAVDLLAGGPGEVAGAVALTPVEAAALELLALVALDGALAAPAVAALAPRLTRGPATSSAADLVLDLAIAAGPLRGAARLALPPGAVRALGASSDEPARASRLAIGASLRQGVATLGEGELSALAPGDVVLLDPEPSPAALVLPGGLALRGRLEGDQLTVEESLMNEWTGSFPVALSVEIARVTVSLGELARLEPGGVLPLHVARDGAVVLRAGEHAVARGRLVEIDGALGVRIDAREERP